MGGFLPALPPLVYFAGLYALRFHPSHRTVSFSPPLQLLWKQDFARAFGVGLKPHRTALHGMVSKLLFHVHCD
jgi:hypothetical protein